MEDKISGIAFHKPKRVNEAERVTSKDTRDYALQLPEDFGKDMETICDAPLVLRRLSIKCKQWEFDGSLKGLSKDNFPKELYCYFRWVVNGPNTTLTAEEKCLEVHKPAMNLIQSTV